MIEFDIPGFDPVCIEHVLLDYNGTIALDGILPNDVAAMIRELSQLAQVHVLTADTYGTVRSQCQGIGVEVQTFPRAGAAQFKTDFANKLQGGVACLGNGRNDIGMFQESDLAIAVIDGEGACAKLLPFADIVSRSMAEALALLLNPDRVRATLRS